MIERIGRRTVAAVKTVGRFGHFMGDLARAVPDVDVWGRLTLVQLRRVGVDSLPVALFIAAFTGVVLALQASYTFRNTVPLYFVGTLVGKTMMLELGPVLAGTAMFPIIVALAIVTGILTGWIASLALLDLTTPEFIKGLKLFYRFKDTWFGLFKSATFGFTITLVGCVVGLGTRGGAEGVGLSTTRAVVYSAVLLLVLDAFWALVLLR